MADFSIDYDFTGGYIWWRLKKVINMNGLELNKIAAAVLVAGIIAMVAGILSDALYHPEQPKARGFSVEVAEAPAAGAPAAPQIVELGLLLASASIDKGKELSKKCATCHTFGKGEANKIGPNLYGIVGSTHGHKDDFTYSDAMKSLHDKTWDIEALYHFIRSPQGAIKGTKMAFAGIKNPEELAAMLAYLNSNSDSPKALPKDLKIK
jgi:cytochrome c